MRCGLKPSDFSNVKTLHFHIQGMHCPSCERLTEAELASIPGVVKVQASLARHMVEVTGDFPNQSDAATMQEMNARLRGHGFTLSTEAAPREVKWAEFAVAAPAALALIVLFLMAQKFGMGRQADFSQMGYGVSFIVGVVASLSSCMAIVGGLVLSLSAYYAQRGEKLRPQLLFHAARLVAFFVLGGVAGAAGSFFHFNEFGAMVLGVGVGLIMLITGVGLLDVFHWPRRFQFAWRGNLVSHAHKLTGRWAVLLPIALGAATFFLPCGYTQSMQAYALSTGSFSKGALTMLCFALGTFPVLAILSFSSLGTHGREKSGVFFKTAGLLVALFGIYDILGSLASYGIIPPLFAF